MGEVARDSVTERAKKRTITAKITLSPANAGALPEGEPLAFATLNTPQIPIYRLLYFL